MNSKSDEKCPSTERRGLPIATNPNAESASVDLPTFLARPLGAPIYHGFKILEDVKVDGFTLGIISDFELEPAAYGDAFVIAPDGSRAGLVWETCSTHNCEVICEETEGRWGVWAVSFPYPMTNRGNALLNLASVLPQLKRKWEAWQQLRSESNRMDLLHNSPAILSEADRGFLRNEEE